MGGAQYKVCFCDRDTLAAGRFCKKASDYKIDIGTLHFSGVSCLIADSKFQRGTCVEQYHGGLRVLPLWPGGGDPGGPDVPVSLSSSVFLYVDGVLCGMGDGATAPSR